MAQTDIDDGDDDDKDEYDELRVPVPPPRRLSRSSIDLRDLEQERFEKVTHTDSAPSMITLHYMNQQQTNQAQYELQIPAQPIAHSDNYRTQTVKDGQISCTTYSAAAIAASREGKMENDGGLIQIFGINGEHIDIDIQQNGNTIGDDMKQAPVTLLSFAKDNLELKRLIEDNYLYHKRQNIDKNLSVPTTNTQTKYSAHSESDFSYLKHDDNKSSRKPCALSDSAFLKSQYEQTKQLETDRLSKINKGFTIKTFLAKAKLSSTECFSLEKRRHHANSEQIRSSHIHLLHRLRNRKLSLSYNGGLRRQKKGLISRPLSNTESAAFSPDIFSESLETSSRYNTPDILLDILYLNDQSEKDSLVGITPLPHYQDNVTQTAGMISNKIRDSDLSATDILTKNVSIESSFITAASLSPTSIIDASIPDDLKCEVLEPSHINQGSTENMISPLEIMEIFRSFSFPSAKHTNPQNSQYSSSNVIGIPKTTLIPTLIKQHTSTLSDHILLKKTGSTFEMTPPITPTFNSVSNLATLQMLVTEVFSI